MHPDLTRSTYDPADPFVRVVMQQGRVQLDADWNEQIEILQGLRRDLTTDVVGESGTPDTNGKNGKDGFKITATGPGGTLEIGRGTYYADGWRCTNPDNIPITAQPGYPGYVPPDTPGDYVAYLDVWTRTVTAITDPSLADPALAGLDTAVRSALVWQVKLAKAADFAGLGVKHAAMRVATQAGPPGTISTLTVPGAGYTGLENLLYLVQIQQGGGAGTATLKWSRYNGSLAFKVVDFRDPVIELASLGRTPARSLRPGDWIELVGADSELRGTQNPLRRIQSVDESSATVVLEVIPPPAGPRPVQPIAVIRWDQTTDDGVIRIDAERTKIPIENGIFVSFEQWGQGAFQVDAGDFWMIPARLDGRLLWPQDPHQPGAYAARPPDGVEHVIVELAACKLTGGTWSVTDDKRKTFLPLEQVSSPRAEMVVYRSSTPPALKGGVSNVKLALDAIGSWARHSVQVLRVAPDGQFTSLKELEAYLSGAGSGALPNDLVVVIGAGPGRHDHNETADVTITPWAAASDARLTLTFMGESPQTAVTLSGALSIGISSDMSRPGAFAEVRFTGLRLIVDSLAKSGTGIYIEGADTLRFDQCYVFGNIVRTSGAHRAAVSTSAVRDLVLDRVSCDMMEPAYTNASTVRIIADVNSDSPAEKCFWKALEDFVRADLTTEPRPTLLERAAAVVTQVKAMHDVDRKAIRTRILQTEKAKVDASPSVLLWDAFVRLAGMIGGSSSTADFEKLTGSLIQLFEAMMWSVPTAAFVALDVPDSITVNACRIAGTIAYGVNDPNGHGRIPDERTLRAWDDNWSDIFTKSSLNRIVESVRETAVGSLTITDSTLASVTWGVKLVEELAKAKDAVDDPPPPLGMFDAVCVTSSRLLGPLCCLAGYSVRVESCEIPPSFVVVDSRTPPLSSFNVAHVLIGKTLIVTGNTARYRRTKTPKPSETHYDALALLGASTIVASNDSFLTTQTPP